MKDSTKPEIRPNEQAVFDYMQEQAENLLDFCIRNGVVLENPGFFVAPECGYVYIAATRKGGNGKADYILSKNKNHSGKWDEEVAVLKVGDKNGK